MSDRFNGKLRNVLGQEINPATTEGQDAIVTAIGSIVIPAPVGGATSDNQTNGLQKIQIVDAGGEAVSVTDGKLDVNSAAPVGGATEVTLEEVANTSFWLKSLIRLLKPLSIVTGGGSNRLSVDVNAVTGAVSTVTTVTTVTTVASATNQVNMGNVAAFTMQQSLLRNAFANGIRKNLV